MQWCLQLVIPGFSFNKMMDSFDVRDASFLSSFISKQVHMHLRLVCVGGGQTDRQTPLSPCLCDNLQWK